MRLPTRTLTIALLASVAFAADPTARTLEWTDLIPESARGEFSSAQPPATHDYLGESGPAALQQSVNAPVNPELDGKLVKIPGFIVPVIQ
jgi:hypothetical protein